jgi:hypothetical protein
MPNQVFEGIDEMQPSGSDKQQRMAQRQPIPAFTPTSIRVSTPPVKIIDSEPRLAVGHCLADR